MATNTLLTISDVTRELLMLFVGNLQAVKSVNKDYDNSFGKVGRKIGETLAVRLPNRFAVGSGAAVTATDYTETTVPVVLNQQKNIALEFTSKDLTLSLDDFSQRFLRPMASKLAATVEADLLTVLKNNSFQQVGTPGTAITDLSVFFDAMAALQNFLVPYDDIKTLIAPTAYSKAAKLMLNMFTPVTNEKIHAGSLGHAVNSDWYISQYLASHTVGAHTGTKLVNGATQTGSTIALDGFANSVTGALKQGDIITLAGVNFAHPMTGADTGNLASFVVTADANSNGTGQVNATIYPAIITSGPYKTVTASPADNAVVTVAGGAGSTYNVNMMIHRDAAVFVSAPLDVPGAVPGNVWQETDPESGVSVTVESFRDGRSGSTLFRADVLYGVSPLRRECGVRIVTA